MGDGAPGLKVNVLGPLEVTVGGRPVSLHRHQERLLFVLLAARAPEPVPTQQLIAELWGEQATDGARATLRVYISTLRKRLQQSGVGEAIARARDGYALVVSAPEALDSVRFTRLLSDALSRREAGERDEESRLLRSALDLWRGRALAEAASVPSVAPVARRLEEQRLLALEQWADAEIACSRYSELAAALSPLCVAEPTAQPLWARWMLALHRCGRDAEALAAYHELYRRLRDEFGLTPHAEVRAVELAILRAGSGLVPPGSVRDPRQDRLPAALRTHGGGAFVGRRTELSSLWKRASLAAAGAAQLLVVVGEAGVGKSRLVCAWAEQAHIAGHAVMYGRAERGTAVLYQPFAEALAPYSGAPFEALGFDRAGIGSTAEIPGLARLRLFDAVTELFVSIAADRPVALIVDDVHRADPSSMALLRHVIRRAGEAPLLVLATSRQRVPDFEAIAELADDPGLTTLELEGLSRAEVAELLAAVGGGHADVSAADLHALSGGNPLLVRQALAQLELAGGATTLPGAIGEALKVRLDQAPLEVLEMLSVGALIGAEFTLGELEAVTGSEMSRDVLRAVEIAVRMQLIAPVEVAQERYRFAHDLIREAVIEQLSDPLRRRLHDRIGAAFEPLGEENDGRLAALAHHFAEAARPGQTARGADYAVRAGRRALERLAFEQAAQAAGRGLRCLALDPDVASTRRCDLELLLAEARLYAPDVTGCREAAGRAAQDARELGDSERLARAAILASHLNNVGQPIGLTRDLCVEALSALDDDSPLAVKVLAGYADYLAIAEGDCPRAEHLSRRAVLAARPAGDNAALARALWVHGVVLGWGPRIGERLQVSDQLRTLAVAERDPLAEADAYHLSALARLESGDIRGFHEDADRIDQLRPQIRYWWRDMMAALWRGMCAMLDGNLDAVEPHAELVLAQAEHEPNAANLYAGQLMWLRREQGRLAELQPLALEIVRQNPRVAGFRCALGLIHAELGELRAAREQLDELAAGRFAAIPRDVTFTTSLALLTEISTALGDRPAAGMLAELLAPYSGLLLAGTMGMICLGAADRYLAMLAATTGEPDRARELFESAIKLERRADAAALVARSEASRARAFRSLARSKQ